VAKAERIIAVSRDAGCILVGLGGIVHQQITGNVSEALLLVYTTLLGVPMGIGLLSLRQNGGPATTGPSSPSPDQPSPPASSSPSPSASGGGEG
jgi:hypothetical protein